MKRMKVLGCSILCLALACGGSKDESTGADDGASDGVDSTDGTDSVCSRESARCEGQVSFTCSSEGSAEESWDCSKDGLVCVDGACVSEMVDCVKIRPLELRTSQPTRSSVAVVFAVDTCDGQPVIGLKAAQFEVREDGDAVSATESSVTLVQRPAEVFVSLVLDNSPSVRTSGALDAAVDAAKAYASAILADSEGRVRVSVSFFSKALAERLGPTTDVDAVLGALEALRTDTSGFNTTNLYGAVVDALASSRSRQEARRKQVNGGVTTLGQVVIFTDGDDQAGVKTLSEATAAVEGSADDVIMLTLGGDVEPTVIGQLGRNGSYVVSSVAELSGAFTDAAKRTRALQKRIYVLGYCSPKLAKEHELSLSVAGASGESPGVTFDASGFDAGSCSSATFEAACDGLGCGGLLCGECGEGSCGSDLCSCPENRGGLHCEACSDRFVGPTCNECSAKFTGPSCDLCADPKLSGANCELCSDPHYAAPACNSCKLPWAGPNCKGCADATFTGPNCDACSDPKLTGKSCDQCSDPHYAAPECMKCAPPWSGPNCDQCDCPQGEFCSAGGCALPPSGFSLIESAGKSFVMGSPGNELGRGGGEVQHKVTFTYSFLMQRTEVTQAEWESLMGNNPSYFYGCTTCPVERVSYLDAFAYANALSIDEGLEPCYDLLACEGTPGAGSFSCFSEVDWLLGLGCQGYRLPTEAEWEYAARGGTTGATYTGELTSIGCDDQTLPTIAWYCGNADEQTHPVGQLAPNEFGVYDMLGNVWEWTWDGNAPYATTDATDPAVNGSGQLRVTRGGAWDYEARYARAAERAFWYPMDGNVSLGFRLARSVP